MSDKLIGVHPTLVEKIQRVLQAMSILGHPMMVTDGVRTLQQQQALYAQGRTTPGKIVTQADGIRNKSNHQVKDDGLGYAVDCAFATGDPYDGNHPWYLYGTCLAAVGLTWGGNWVKFPDRPHAELKP